MHRLSTNFVLGYHGCDLKTAEALIAGEPFKPSSNDYDWLGHGIYFWEANPQRGLDFALEVSKRKNTKIIQPAVVGAVIELGQCLDMATQSAVEMVKLAYNSQEATFRKAGQSIQSALLRPLDCAVVMRAHTLMEQQNIKCDTVRGIFIEGEPIYPGSGFNSKTHTQIAVRNIDCIKGVFRVPHDHLRPILS